MKKLREIMREGFLHTVRASASVYDAAAMMARENVGIVAVMDDEALVGVLSERDVVQRVVARGLDPRSVPVNRVMTSDVIVATDAEDYQAAMQMMDARNIRHLPVVRGRRVVSMLSIRDLMRAEMSRLESDCREMHAYLHSVPPEGPPR
jgi:CBS domain-containing protein